MKRPDIVRPQLDPATLQPPPGRRRIIASAEGFMLQLGLLIGVLTIVAFGISWHFFPEWTLTLAGVTGLNLAIGRAAGMSFGYASGLTHAQVIPISMVLETIQVLVVYPMFVLSLQNLLDLPRLKPLVTRMQMSAEAKRGTIRKFGIFGLFVFVFMPFWMTGPVAGSLIGFLIGLRPWINVTVVLSATYVAIGVWALLLNELNAWAATIDRFAPFALVLALALLIAAGHFVRWHRRRPRKV
ncbi:MAG: small multi-drug export protein [Burkholderiales bacterium]